MKWSGLLSGIALLAACGSDLSHDAAFDPESPLEKQAKSVLTGAVALDGEGDSAGVNVQLQNNTRTYSVDTGADGAFKLTGVVPGAYSLRIGTRYFKEHASTISLSLGDSVDLGTQTLEPLQADVRGTATVEELIGTAVAASGGALVSLQKTGSVRAPSASPASLTGFFGMAEKATDETNNYTTLADASGAFQISGVEAGVYRLTATTSGAAPAVVVDVTVTGEDGTVTLEPLTLEKVSGAFSISATVGGLPNFSYSDSVNVSLTLFYHGAEKVDLGESASGQAAGCLFTRTVSVAASLPHTLSGSGIRHVCAKFLDAVGNTSAISLSSIIVDADAPSGGVAFNNGAEYITVPQSAYLTFTAFDAGSGVAQLKVTEPVGNESCATALSRTSAEAYTSVRPAPLTIGQNGVAATICAVFRDGAGNWMATPVSDTVMVDDVAPLAGSLSIDNGAFYASSSSVSLTLTATGASEMRMANGLSASSASWEPYRSNVASWPLGSVQGLRTVTVQFRDAAGNASGAVSNTITLDTVAPSSPTISINAGNSTTNGTSVQLTLSAVDATRMQISNDGLFDSEPLVTYATLVGAWPIAAGDGAKTIYVRYADSASNMSAVAAASIVLDTASPVNASISIDAGAVVSTTAAGTANLTLAALDLGTSVSHMKIANLTGGACGTALAVVLEEAFVASRSWVFASPGAEVEGSRTVCAAFRDAIGNWSAPVSDSIQYDTLAPQIAGNGIVINDGASWTTGTQVQLLLSATGASEMMLGNDGSFAGSLWEPYRATTTWYLASTNGSRSVSVQFRDTAGNVNAGPFADTIGLDTAAPSSPSLAVPNQAGFITTATVSLTLSAVDATWMQLSTDGFFDTESVMAYATSKPWTFTGGDGVKFLYARYLDDASNSSQVVAASVQLDSQAPTSGGIEINDGAILTKNGTLALRLTAVEATEMYLSGSACKTGASWTGYTPNTNKVVGPANQTYWLYVAYRDRAHNETPCYAAAITLDTVLTAPSLAVAVSGTEFVPGRTRNSVAIVGTAGLTADVTEMQISDDSGFAGASWFNKTAVTSFLLEPGDGLKLLYVRFRDAAGNLSATFSPSITLDQTPPDAPQLGLMDRSGDGFAVSKDSVELAWPLPADPNLAGFILQRYIVGVSSTFTTIASLGSTVNGYTDWVTASSGATHAYRIMARDDLNNQSSYSLLVPAYPFAPVTRVFKINTYTGFRYFFPPNAGTFTLSPAYSWEDADSNLTQTSLVANTTEWARQAPPQTAFNETLTLRTSNQDSSLVYDTVVPLDLNLRTKFMNYNRGHSQAMAVSATGEVHVALANVSNLVYLTNKTGAWAEQSWSGGWPAEYRGDSIALDASGNPHISYRGTHVLQHQYYTGSAWVDEVVDLVSDTGLGNEIDFQSDIAIDTAGNIHIVYKDYTNNDLMYAMKTTAPAAVWVTTAVDSTGNVGGYARITVSAAGIPHVVYFDATNSEVRHATKPALSWVTSTVETGVSWNHYENDPNSIGGADIAMGPENMVPDGEPRIAYVKGGGLRLATHTATWNWATMHENIANSAIGWPSLTMDGNGKAHVAYFDGLSLALVYATNSSGPWEVTPLHTAADPGRFSNIAIDGQNDLHFAYQDDNAQGGYLRLVAQRAPTGMGGTGLGGSAVTSPSGALHTAFWWGYGAQNFIFMSNESGSWRSETVTSVTGYFRDSDISLGVRANGSVHAVYRDYGTGGVRYARRLLTGVWKHSVIDADPNVGAYAQIAVGGDDKLWVTYTDNTTNDRKVKLASKVGNNPWVIQTLDTLGSYNNNSWTKMKFAADGTLVLLIVESQKWFKIPPAGVVTPIATYGAAVDASFALDRFGKVHVAAREPALDKLMYCTNQTGTYTCEVASTSGNLDVSSGVWADAEGKAHIVYRDSDYRNLRYATNVSGAWQVVPLDGSLNVGTYLSYLVDGKGKAHVFYRDEAAGTLKYIYDFSGWLTASSITQTTPF